MLFIICLVANGFPQRIQAKTSASLSILGLRASLVNSNLGVRLMACSGQVFSHSPHCTQLRSINLSWGNSLESRMAFSGHAPTQAMHKVQVSLLTSILP